MRRETRLHIRELEADSIYVLREAAAQFERPVLLFGGGKDSIVMVHIAVRAFRPARMPFTLVHVDTGLDFPETLDFRDALVARLGVALHVAPVQDSIDAGRVHEDLLTPAGRDRLHTVTLLDTLEELGADCALSAARRDEEGIRCKERVFSHRDRSGRWTPEGQCPELWDLYNGHLSRVEHFRVFPLSEWTEVDVWRYVSAEDISVPSLYFSEPRMVVRRHGALLPEPAAVRLADGEQWERHAVRLRRLSEAPAGGLIESTATSVSEVIAEASARADEDGRGPAGYEADWAAEARRREGYY